MLKDREDAYKKQRKPCEALNEEAIQLPSYKAK